MSGTQSTDPIRASLDEPDVSIGTRGDRVQPRADHGNRELGDRAGRGDHPGDARVAVLGDPDVAVPAASGNSVNTPAVVMRMIVGAALFARLLIAHRLPSGPSTIAPGWPAVGSGSSVITPVVGLMRPIFP